jgi:hypothetical protein
MLTMKDSVCRDKSKLLIGYIHPLDVRRLKNSVVIHIMGRRSQLENTAFSQEESKISGLVATLYL